RERRQARHVYSKIYPLTAPSSVRSGIKGRDTGSPCRSYGACNWLVSRRYRQVAPNGALNRCRVRQLFNKARWVLEIFCSLCSCDRFRAHREKCTEEQENRAQQLRTSQSLVKN